MNPYIKQANQQFVPVYNRYPIVWDHGEGMYLYDTEGKRYLDFGSGIGVCALGYHDQNYTRTLQEQMEKLLHTSNLFYNVPAIEAAKLFNQASGMEQVFFTNSGTEAIEGAVKIAKNSMTELYTNMRYLQYNTLQRLGLGHFDSWAASFGETQTAIDIACQL